VTLLPTDRLSLQVSVARMRDAWSSLAGPPDFAATRLSVSSTYVRAVGETIWSWTAGFGASRGRELVSGVPFETTNGAALVESSVTMADRHTLLGRAELARMPGHHLHALEYARQNLTVGKIQGGYVRQFRAGWGLSPGLGATVALSLLPPALAPRYSGRTASSLSIFFVLRPSRHVM
jgi:hypothetical protein